MEKNLSGTLAIDLGNTNTVVAFQDQKDINSTLVEIPNITSSPGVIPTAVWFEESSKITKIGISALKMRDNPILGIFEGSSNQTAEGIIPGDDVIFGISTKTELLSF